MKPGELVLPNPCIGCLYMGLLISRAYLSEVGANSLKPSSVKKAEVIFAIVAKLAKKPPLSQPTG